jgi:hypothetical protein
MSPGPADLFAMSGTAAIIMRMLKLPGRPPFRIPVQGVIPRAKPLYVDETANYYLQGAYRDALTGCRPPSPRLEVRSAHPPMFGHRPSRQLSKR